VEYFVVDTTDEESLREVCASSRVVLTTVGPFAKYGDAVVKVCAELGTHYCDITGEVPWVKRMIRKHDEEAKRKGIKIVHMCGFDSIPSDLGTLLVVDHMKKQYNKACSKVELLYMDAKGTFSGGTVASLFHAIFEEKGEDAKAAQDPYGLDPPSSSRGPDAKDSFWPGYSQLLGKHTMPFVMSIVNTRVVRRSQALLGHPYGHFSYQEGQAMPGRIAAYVGSFAFVFLGGLFSLRPLQPLWARLLPKAGSGPDKKTQLEGYWRVQVAAQSEEPQGVEPTVVRAELKGDGDPGYWSTSRMLLECGLCIAQQEEELKESGALQSGVLTPATALGTVLIKRLTKCPMFTFKLLGADVK
jgi:short subunit dehydrogenase-like uncharacterized protein